MAIATRFYENLLQCYTQVCHRIRISVFRFLVKIDRNARVCCIERRDIAEKPCFQLLNNYPVQDIKFLAADGTRPIAYLI